MYNKTNMIAMENQQFDANLYAAYLEGRTTKDEDIKVLNCILEEPNLVLTLNLSAFANN